MLQKGGALRDFWMPRLLQMRYFNENVAGEAFFERLAAIRRDPTRSDVLRVYYLCLLFGFRGKYRVRGGELELLDIIDARAQRADPRAADPDRARAVAERAAQYEPLADARRNMLMVWLSVVAAVVTSVLLYVGAATEPARRAPRAWSSACRRR